MRFQERDGAILQTIYDYDGVLAGRHIKNMFWPDKTLRAMQGRLSKLFRHGYIARPTREQWKTKPIPETIYWLGWKGVLWTAAKNGVNAAPPKNEGENQMRKLKNSLRRQGIRWQREPRWMQLAHDLAVADLHLAVEKAAQALDLLTLETWTPEGAFLSNPDVIEYKTKDEHGRTRRRRKGLRPDGYFVIIDSRLLARGKPAIARHLVEVDGSTHTNTRFGQEKAVPGAAYLESPEYKARFGANAGRWLVITGGEKRMRNLMDQTQREIGQAAQTFYFTRFELVKERNVLTDPIWHRADLEKPVALFTGDFPSNRYQFTIREIGQPIR